MAATSSVDHLAFRRICLGLWLDAIVRHPVIKRSPYLYAFLTSHDEYVSRCVSVVWCVSCVLCPVSCVLCPACAVSCCCGGGVAVVVVERVRMSDREE
jgi:hypothetical protein